MAISSLPFRDRAAPPSPVPPIITTDLQHHPNVTQTAPELPTVDHSTSQRSDGPVPVTEDRERRRVTLVDAPLPDSDNPPQYNQTSPQQQPRLRAPVIAINGSRSDSNMHHTFSLRRSKSGAKAKQADKLGAGSGGNPSMHARNHSMTYGEKNGNLAPSPSGLQRSMSKRQKFVRAFTNPDKIFDRDPTSPPPESR
jgi:hypothetical protein